MRIISVKTLQDYWEKHKEVEIPLREWYCKVEKAEWHNFNDIRKDFNSVDYAGNQKHVFNIKGNNYRLIVAIKFTPKLVYIRFVGTHNEYSRIRMEDL